MKKWKMVCITAALLCSLSGCSSGPKPGEGVIELTPEEDAALAEMILNDQDVEEDVDESQDTEAVEEIQSTEPEFVEEQTVSDAADENKDYAAIEAMIWNDETMYTFGDLSTRYMTLENVTLLKKGTEEGVDFFEIALDYVSEYGDISYTGKVYYIPYEGAKPSIISCVIHGMSADNPKIDRESVERDYVNPYIWAADYYPAVEKDGEMHLESDVRYTFSNGYVGRVVLESLAGIMSGTYTVDESDREEYEICLRYCWDDNGLCQTYYGYSHLDKQILCLDYEDPVEGIIGERQWLGVSGIKQDDLNKILTAE